MPHSLAEGDLPLLSRSPPISQLRCGAQPSSAVLRRAEHLSSLDLIRELMVLRTRSRSHRDQHSGVCARSS
eukprot:scaffold79599_cov13-Tisochrysis_lutea.AAC.1